MRYLLLVGFLLAGLGLAQDDLESRVAELERRVAALEAVNAEASAPANPANGQEVEGFTFQRVNLRNTSVGLELLGEVTGSEQYESVRFRYTLYDEAGNILETSEFSVSNVGPTPRTFSTAMFSDYRVDDVAALAWQVENTR